VTKVLAEEGQMITTMPPAIIFALSDTLTLEVRVPVPERMLSRIKVGQAVNITFNAIDNFNATGTVDN
jgi:multidrug resistance efflux pump